MVDELSALRLLKERFKNISKSVFLGIGDDAAAVKINPENLLLATTDSQVEDIHFVKELISPRDLGRKSVAVSVSDIAAMGGVPRFFLTSVGFPKSEDERFVSDITDGFRIAAEEFRIELIGGNLSASDKVFLDITVLGEVEPHLMIKRSGAKPGDVIYLSGTVGDSALGLRILQSGEEKQKDGLLISRHIAPQPRLTIGRELAQRRLATSMIDVSDGLILDTERITVEYGVGAQIYIDQVPVSSHYKSRIFDFMSDPHELAVSGGEDYELLFTSPEEKRMEIKEVSSRLNLEITEIGRVIDEPSVRVLDLEGKEIEVRRKGFIHLST